MQQFDKNVEKKKLLMHNKHKIKAFFLSLLWRYKNKCRKRKLNMLHSLFQEKEVDSTRNCYKNKFEMDLMEKGNLIKSGNNIRLTQNTRGFLKKTRTINTVKSRFYVSRKV